jgi:hypothetical protein
MAIVDPATDATREVRDLVTKARQSLQSLESDNPVSMSAQHRAVYYLATAIDKLVNETLIPAFQPEDTSDIDNSTSVYSAVDLEELYASIADRVERPDHYRHLLEPKKFVISFPDVELTIDDIWPDGDAPDDPTPEGVIEAMKETDIRASKVTKQWDLIESLTVRYGGDEDGHFEVKWDGS